MTIELQRTTLPRPDPVWTVKWCRDEEPPMVRVLLNVGQYQFQAGAECRDPSAVPFVAANVMAAVNMHALGRKWF